MVYEICAACGLTTYSKRLLYLVGPECPRCGGPLLAPQRGQTLERRAGAADGLLQALNFQGFGVRRGERAEVAAPGVYPVADDEQDPVRDPGLAVSAVGQPADHPRGAVQRLRGANTGIAIGVSVMVGCPQAELGRISGYSASSAAFAAGE